jgi:pilus assembly protein Flp/PilA
MYLSIILRKAISQFNQEEDAVTAIEYALITSLIALAIITAVTTLGTTLAGVFTSITAKL